MSKTTKIIAALGVVAGLGVAALPAFTFAVSPINGNVEVQVEVQPAIAMTIEGNNDNGDHKAKAFVAKTPTENPQQEGLYETDSTTGGYKLTTDTTPQGGKTYYEPNYHTVRNYSPDTLTTGDSIGSFTIAQGDPVLGTSSSYIAMLPSSVFNGLWTANPETQEDQFGSKITVYTNSTSGYKLTLKDADTDNALKNMKGITAADIPAGTETGESNTFTLVAGTKAWGYKVNAAAKSDADYKAVPVSTAQNAALIDESSAATSGGRTAYVTYGVATADDQPTGMYSDTIIYTATVN